ncbi:MAG: RNA polymerase sigma factor [Planctomycetota bacterium]|jgi:RNA polymerase sigma factor (sigma-70 family)
MTFPQTRLTLVQRLASGGTDDDWHRFLKDYWGPICRFALRRGAGSLNDAEDVASQAFAVVWENQLLTRWVSHRSAKLRSLLCAVVRNILSNRHRVRTGRQRRSGDLARQVEQMSRARDDQSDAFYAAWVEDVLQRAVESLAAEYFAQSKADYVRVLYGRLCQGLTIAEVAQALDLTGANVDHYFRHARKRLADKLEQMLRDQVAHYCPPEEMEDEFALEWRCLGDYLGHHGGLDEAVRRAYDLLDPVETRRHREAGLTQALARLTSVLRAPSSETSSKKTT